MNLQKLCSGRGELKASPGHQGPGLSRALLSYLTLLLLQQDRFFLFYCSSEKVGERQKMVKWKNAALAPVPEQGSSAARRGLGEPGGAVTSGAAAGLPPTAQHAGSTARQLSAPPRASRQTPRPLSGLALPLRGIFPSGPGAAGHQAALCPRPAPAGPA